MTLRRKVIALFLILAIGVAPKVMADSLTHQIIDLGAAPWRFTRVTTANQNQPLTGSVVSLSGTKLPQTVTVDLGKDTTLKSFQDTFAETQIRNISFKLEGSTDGRDWAILLDKTKPGDAAVPSLNKSANVGATAGSVGFVEQAVSVSIGGSLSGRCRFVRLTISGCDGGKPPVKHALEFFGGADENTSNADYAKPNFDDSHWETVGLPHCFNDQDTYLNAYDGHMWRGVVWYRRHLDVKKSDLGKRHIIEFEGVTMGAAVYVNGIFQPGHSSVKQPGDVTHVGQFLPFAVDISGAIHAGDNVIAVRVSNLENTFYTGPRFEDYAGFGMNWGGIVSPVRLHITSPIFIPMDAATADGIWGTYTGVTEADDAKAEVRAITRVKNTTPTEQSVTLTTTFISPSGAKVLSLKNTRTIASGTYGEFDQSGSIANPVLWYPNNSPYGKPQLHLVMREVAVAGKIVDIQEAKCGLRVIAWTGDYCLINGRKHLLLGFGNRNIYPALGSAIPAALQWQDIALIAQCGGNCLRVGHVPTTQTMLDACDAYGVLVMQESGDNEWALKNEPALTYKHDFDREVIIASRNHPSVLLWESNNGLAKNGDIYWPSETKKIADENDFIRPRIVSTRDGYPARNWDKKDRILVGRSNNFRKVEDSPSLNVEVYGAVWKGGRSHNIARDDYEDEKEFCTWFVNDFLKDINGRACGWIDWMLAETQGEGYTIYLNGRSKQKSLGSCAMDGNRFPKLKYEIYRNALWLPFASRPGVVLQSHWNLDGVQDVYAWSNCRRVELFLNGQSLGVREPNPDTKYCEWPGVVFAPGILKAVGLGDHNQPVCESVRETAGAPDHIVLKVEPPTVHPGGITFPVRANGSDAAIVTAMVADKNGRWCPLATNSLTFAVSGEGNYCGSYNFYITPDKPLGYHGPGDHELAAEGGLMRVAIRSTFKSGKVTVNCTSPGLAPGNVSYATLRHN